MLALVEKIINVIDSILNQCMYYVAPNQNFHYLRWTSIVFCFIAFFCLFYYLGKTDIIRKTAKDSYDKFMLNKLSNAAKTYKESKFWRKFRSKFAYSSINKYIVFMTAEIWLAFLIVLFFLMFVVTISISKNAITSLILGGCAVGLMLFIENILAFSNYKKVDRNLLEFLNMIGNYSSQNTEVTDVFSYIYNRVEEPMSTALKECIFEAESVGTETALLNLADKIEHPKFKEIIQNIRIAAKSSNSFKNVVKNNSNLVSNYMKQKKDAESRAIGNFVQLIICSIFAVIVIVFCGKISETNMLLYIRDNITAQVELFIAVISVAYAGWQIYSISK